MDKDIIATLTIHKIIGGSNLYGFAGPGSDIDIRGVCLAPLETLLGLQRFEQYVETKDADVTIYELRRFCQLALKANPNILDLLFAPKTTWLVDTKEWNRIYNERHVFLSQKVRHTYSGYAFAQLKRIKGHKEWLDNPPNHQPTQDEFGGVWQGDGYVFSHLHAEQTYKSRLKAWNQYQAWLKNRNPKRAELERKHGYDTKHAAHLVRLCLQVGHILRDCDYNPVLNDEDLAMVLAVKQGAWEYERLVEWTEKQDAMIQDTPTALPRKPSFNHIEQIVIGIYRSMLFT